VVLGPEHIPHEQRLVPRTFPDVLIDEQAGISERPQRQIALPVLAGEIGPWPIALGEQDLVDGLEVFLNLLILGQILIIGGQHVPDLASRGQQVIHHRREAFIGNDRLARK
jgi:hypothetical protein